MFRKLPLAVVEANSFGIYRPTIVSHTARICAAVEPQVQELVENPVLESLLRTHDATLLRYLGGYGNSLRFPQFPMLRFFSSLSDRLLHQWADGARSTSVFLSGMTDAVNKQLPGLAPLEVQKLLQSGSPLLRLLAAHGTRSLNFHRAQLTNESNENWGPPSLLFEIVELDNRPSIQLSRSPFRSRAEQNVWGKCIGARQIGLSSTVDEVAALAIFYAPTFIDEIARLPIEQTTTTIQR